MSKPSQPSPPLTETLAAWLKRRREDRDLPLRAVAEAARMDVSALAKAEKGERMVTEEQARALAAFHGEAEDDVLLRLQADRLRREFTHAPAGAAAVRLVAEELAAYPLRPPQGT